MSPSRLHHQTTALAFRRLFGAVVLTVVLGSAIWAARVTQAEFEVPLVDTTDFVSTNFRSVWAYHRTTRWDPFNSGPNFAGGSIHENYEGFAVGQPDSIENGTTSLYRYDGQVWEKMIPQGPLVMGTNFQLNATGGRIDTGAGYAELKLLGRQDGANRRAMILGWPNFPGDIVSGASYNYKSDPKEVGRAILNNHSLPDSAIKVDFVDNANVAYATVPADSELYALGMAPNFGGSTLAGGMNGWLGVYKSGMSNPCLANFYRNQSTATCATSAEKAAKEKWYLFQLNDAARAPTTNDSITSVMFVNSTSGYITTSTFPNDAQGKPKQPYLHDCSNDGTSRSKLFRVDGSARFATNWTKLVDLTGECFYGLTATPIDQASATNGPLVTEVWVASSKGVRRITDDNTATPPNVLVKDTYTLPATDPLYRHAAYGVVSSYERSGNGQQLLLNGNFQSWTKPMTGANATDPTNLPTGYIKTGKGATTKTADGVCGSGDRDAMMLNRGGPSGNINWGIKIEPGLEYSASCVAAIDTRTRVVSFSQPINLSDIEGTRFRVRGTYKVTYVPDDTDWSLQPIIRQGGVTVNCSGAYPPNNIDCPYSNMRELRTMTGPGTTGDVNFSFEFTRSQNQLTSPIIGHGGVPWLSDSGFMLEIRCQATFGVSVECDDLVVETVSNPPIDARSVVSVLAVGDRGMTLYNPDATGTGSTNTWTVDDTSILNLPGNNDITLNSVVNGGGGHIFTAGTGTALLQRSPGNISGFAWLGATQDGTGVTGKAALGWIATNCANLKNSAQRSLCQRHSQSFGLSLQDNVLTGRAWFAKQLSSGGVNDDVEGLDLGTCQTPGQRSGLTNYVMTGSCDVNQTSATYRRCLGNTNRACLRDFDCYGRCTGDEAALCLSNNDCVGSRPNPALSPSGSRLRGIPPNNLLCGEPGSSPSACTAAGWLTFNANDLPSGQRTPPAAPTTFGVTYNETTGKLDGWGRFMTLANPSDPNYVANQGWVKLRGPATVASGTKIYGAQSCSQTSSATRCTKDLTITCSTVALIQTCLALGGTCTTLTASTCRYGYDGALQSCTPANASCTNFCGNNSNQPCSNDAECVSLYNNTTDSCAPIGYCSNTLNQASPTTCTSDANCTTAGSFCVRGSVCSSSSGNSCDKYGVDFDEQTGKFQGFAWSSDYGWVDFRAVQKGTTRFLQTRLGDIYAGGNINAATNNCASSRNATYLVTSSGEITNFCSSLEDGGGTGVTGVNVIQRNQPVIPITSSENDYSTALGRFDLTGLETIIRRNGTLDYNKYDLEVVTIPLSGNSITHAGSPFNDTISPLVLGKKVYIANCPGVAPNNTCTLSQALKFSNGASSAQNGAGLLVVNGNLTISNNMQYISSRVDDLRQLASLTVVVRGDLNIENSVTNVVGAYYVQGTIFTTPTATATSSDNRYPLTVRGLMIAKDFEFNRRFAGTVESPLPSELFIFDGRLQSNPLPGMSDFASALPNTQNSSP